MLLVYHTLFFPYTPFYFTCYIIHFYSTTECINESKTNDQCMAKACLPSEGFGMGKLERSTNLMNK